jgi:hypothetical protein
VAGPSAAIETSCPVTVTGFDSSLTHDPLVVVTEYVPGSLTAIARVVAPLDQSHDVPLLAVSVTLSFSQSASEPPAVMVDCPVVTTTASDCCDSQ